MPRQPCLVCQNDTVNYCNGCAQARDDESLIIARFYCGIGCAKRDKIEHLKVHMKLRHTTRQHLERAMKAGKILQSLFYDFLESTWTYDMKYVSIKRDRNHNLVAVEVTDGTGVVTAPGGRTDCKTYAGGWLIQFPVVSFGRPDDDAKHALLTDHGSIWAFVVMHAAVQALFHDLVEDVESDIMEIVHYPVSNALRIVHAQGTFGFETRRRDQLYPDEDERGDVKGVYEIRLKCGSTIILDLAGAQWRLHGVNGGLQPVMYRTDYWSRWGAAIKYRTPFRSHTLKHAAKISMYRLITSHTLIMEIMFCFDVLMLRECKVELGFHPHDLLHMDNESYDNAKQRFLSQALLYLQKRSIEVDIGNHGNFFNAFDIRHPKFIADASTQQSKSNESLPFDIGDMAKFDWKAFSRFIQQPSSKVSLKEKIWAKALQKKRSVYKEPDTWMLVFLDDTLPSRRVPLESICENPRWNMD